MPSTAVQAALPDPLAMAARRVPLQRHDGLSRAQYRAVVAAIALAHVGGIYAILQVPAVRATVLEAAPIFVSLLAPPAPPAAAPPPPTTLVKPLPRPPEPRLITTAPAPQPAQFEAPPAPPVPAPPAPVVADAPPAPPAPPAPAPPPPPPQIPASLVRYLVQPTPVYPWQSQRNKEYGEVVMRVSIDAQGLPTLVTVTRSSGFARLDEAAVAAIRGARFKPYTINGSPVPCSADTSIKFEP